MFASARRWLPDLLAPAVAADDAPDAGRRRHPPASTGVVAKRAGHVSRQKPRSKLSLYNFEVAAHNFPGAHDSIWRTRSRDRCELRLPISCSVRGSSSVAAPKRRHDALLRSLPSRSHAARRPSSLEIGPDGSVSSVDRRALPSRAADARPACRPVVAGDRCRSATRLPAHAASVGEQLRRETKRRASASASTCMHRLANPPDARR